MVKTSELAKDWGVLAPSLTPFWAFEVFGLASRPLSVGHFRGTWFPRPPLGLRKVYGSHRSIRVHYCGRAERVGVAAAYALDRVGPFLRSACVGRPSFPPDIVDTRCGNARPRVTGHRCQPRRQRRQAISKAPGVCCLSNRHALSVPSGPLLGVIVTLGNTQAWSSAPLRNPSALATWVLRARPQRRQNEHGPGSARCVGACL